MSTDITATIADVSHAEVRRTVTLDGTGSIAPDGALFHWTTGDAADGRLFDADKPMARYRPRSTGTQRLHLSISADVPGKGTVADSASIDLVVLDHVVDENAATADDLWWQEQQVEGDRKAVEVVMTAAGKWDATLTALIGVFAAVTFLSGPDALKDVASKDLARLGLVLIASAFVFAFWARLTFANVGNGLPTFANTVSGPQHRSRMLLAARRGAARLRQARLIAVLAALLVAGGSLTVATSSLAPKPSEPPNALVRTTTGTRCGPISTGDAGEVRLAGAPVGPVEEITMVGGCGEAAGATPGSDEQAPPLPGWIVGAAAIIGLVAGIVFSTRRLAPKLRTATTGRDKVHAWKEAIPAAAALVVVAGIARWVAARHLSYLDHPRALLLHLALVVGAITGLLLFRNTPDPSTVAEDLAESDTASPQTTPPQRDVTAEPGSRDSATTS